MTPAGTVPPFDRLSRPTPGRLRRQLRRLSELAVPSRLLRTRQPAGATAPLLTFDDGPDAELTPRILDHLGQAGQQAVFFMLAERAVHQAPLVRRVVAEGHRVANHSWSHPAPGSMTTGDYLRDVARGRGELEALTGVPVRWFRPPHGFLTAAILARLAMARHEVVLWSVDPKDYAAPDVEAVVDHLTRSTLTPRDIVLLHDTSRATADALPRLTAIVAEQAGASR